MYAVQALGMSMSLSVVCYSSSVLSFCVMHAVQALGMSMSLSVVCYSSSVLFFLCDACCASSGHVNVSFCCVLFKFCAFLSV